ncbi:hypothetical protein [uncultured Tyzzerella sp.]|uniref:hypothetical protein n=1 Tax=uncultured Tyzzerella sp. TaxID=2321398 RepID=UPI00294320C9|nr:hypothetical protein [uncultured Tyzzerella sp.]
MKFIILFFGFFSIIIISTIIYKIPVNIISYSNDNITKIIIEGKSTNEYLSIEDTSTIGSVVNSLQKEKFIRQNFNMKNIGYNVHISFLKDDTVLDTLIIHSDNLIQKNSTTYKLQNSKSIKYILTLLEEQLKRPSK